MPSNQQNVALIRRRLGNPLEDSPSDATLMEFLVDNLLNMVSSLNNTRSHWNVYHWTLQAVSGVEDYVVSAGDFGRPFLVYSTSQTDTYFVRQEVPFSLMNDADRRYSGPQQSQSTYPNSAAEIVFYRIGQAWYARLVPIPGASGTYEVWYETNYTYASPSDVVGLESFHNLIRVQTALSALPECQWRGLNIIEHPKEWLAAVKLRKDTLMHDEQKYQKSFNDYRASSMRDGVNAKIGYAPGYDGDGGIGIGSMADGWG